MKKKWDRWTINKKNKKKLRTKGNKKSKKNEEFEDTNIGDDTDDEKSLICCKFDL